MTSFENGIIGKSKIKKVSKLDFQASVAQSSNIFLSIIKTLPMFKWNENYQK